MRGPCRAQKGKPMEILATQNLTKKYGGVYAVKDVNMHIEKGDIYGFVGENGAGKTTVIRLLTGLSVPTSGTYTLFGVPSTGPEIHKAKRKLAAVVESVALAKGMTAFENLRLQALQTGTEKTDAELTELISFVGLNAEGVRKRKVRNFSLGMRQRLGIALVMVSDPELILLDEPMNGLDPQGMIQIRDIIKALHEKGVTILISSHILAELDLICNKIGMISHGELLEEITMEELRKKGSRRTLIASPQAEELRKALSETLHLRNTELSGSELTVYDDVALNDLLAAVAETKIPVTAFQTREESVEDYYIQTIRGGNAK